jgi:hypothetical protein
MTLDVPSGDDRVQDLLAAADIDHGGARLYRSGTPSDDVKTVLADVITAATRGHVSLDGFELHTISHDSARVEITGSFDFVDPADDFESFAQTEGSA